MKPSVPRPWVTWTDGFLCLSLIAMLFSAEWLSYRDGRYGEGWTWIGAFLWPPVVIMLALVLIVRPWLTDTSVSQRAGLLIAPFLLGLGTLAAPYAGLTLSLILLALILRAWLKSPATAQWAQLLIRPLLVSVVALAVVALHKQHLVNLPGATPFVTGCLQSIRDSVTEQDIQALRDLVARKRRDGKLEEGLNAIPTDELPPSFRSSSWGAPRDGEVWFHRQDSGSSISICWGGTLPGYFGLFIDPESPPQAGLQEPDDGWFKWHHKLADGVFFFHQNG